MLLKETEYNLPPYEKDECLLNLLYKKNDKEQRNKANSVPPLLRDN